MKHRTQNYIDRFVADRISLRVVLAEPGAVFDGVISKMRQHEFPHVIILKNAENLDAHFGGFGGFEELPGFPRCIRVWERCSDQPGPKRVRFSFGPEGAAAVNGVAIGLCLGRYPATDVFPDPKQRSESVGSVGEVEHWVQASGDVYYSEHRLLAKGVTLTRIYTTGAQRSMFRQQLPILANGAVSKKGKFIYNWTKRLESTRITQFQQPLLQVKEELKRCRGLLRPMAICNLVTVGVYRQLLAANLIKEENGAFKLTPAGNYVLYHNSPPSSS